MSAGDHELLLDQREANEKLVLATLRAEELSEEARRAQLTAERATERVEVTLARVYSLKIELERSEAELKKAAEFREALLGIVGHDLRNPLAAISMAAALLSKDTVLQEPQSRMLAIITRSAQRMARMIQQLLEFTRARTGGGLPLDPAPADLRRIFHDVIEEQSIISEAKIRCDLIGELTGIWDADRLAQAFSNIISNGLDYAMVGSEILVKAWREESWVKVEISNQGVPISPEILPFIFDPYRRGRQVKSRISPHSKSTNLGLGLYVAQQVMVSHGGDLTARCAGGTTTFALTLRWATAL